MPSRKNEVWNRGDLDEFYDLQSDPHELRNLIDKLELAGEISRLRRRLYDWMAETNDPLLSHC